MPLLAPKDSDDLEGILCTAELAVVAFLDPQCPVCRQYLPVFRAAAKASKNVVFVEAWLPKVADYALRHGIIYAPLTALYSRCRLLAAVPGYMSLEDLRLLVERVAPELLSKKQEQRGSQDDGAAASGEEQDKA